VLICLILGMGFMISTVHKMAGVEMLHSYLFISYIFIVEYQNESLRSFVQILTYFKIDLSEFYNKFSTSEVINHSILESALSSLIYCAIISLLLIIFFIVFLLKKSTLMNIKFMQIKKILYKKIMFPLTLSFLFEIMHVELNFL